jgi:ubiquinone/menaquinone biosynthesis C-methylase UbiE
MDRHDVSPDALRQGLADLRRVNRWFGGTRAALQAALPMVRGVDAVTVRVLDVATGSADIPLALVQHARREGIGLSVLATDLHPATVAAARRNAAGEAQVDVAPADALALPFAAGDFHVAMCNTALHHFDTGEARRLLAELARVASHGVVVTDLARSRTALAGVALLSHTLWRRHPVTHHDSMVSIRGAYTAEEAAEIARTAGLPEPRVRHHPFFRFSLVSDLRRGAW